MTTEKPTDLVRVRRLADGAHITTKRSKADRNKSRYQVLKQDAVDVNGKPLPPKPRRNTSDDKPDEATKQATPPTPTKNKEA